ncbi:heavy metal-responsive transcriptional regulator [Curtobacterium sp. ISL-83]|uniref:heavy metal-responsive transcriptional regulator n=1 Tax=Curtobacterium sp. ISL-83 TaxID=2819145 RepID=UPI001BEB81C7|nr:heavy metal-responsive transcriptional regulator [Curtobacterium sp. ISL-83]MBT2502884.1 heavy metal-responsive transcriptional regulator [Curtobacterium sp. ISL-83]
MRIGEVAAATGVTAQTIRFYERQGLLPSPDRQGNGYRDYDGTAVSRLRFIRAAQTAGLTLSEIEGIISVRNGGETPCGHVSGLLTVKLAEVHDRQREELQDLLTGSEQLDPAACSDSAVCQIFAAPHAGRGTTRS